MLTTIDNPYNPNKDYDKWQMWDHDNHYDTAEYLARVASIPINATDEEAEGYFDDAVQDIMANDVLGIYMIIN